MTTSLVILSLGDSGYCGAQPFGRAQSVGPMGRAPLGLHSGSDSISGPEEALSLAGGPFPLQTSLPPPRCWPLHPLLPSWCVPLGRLLTLRRLERLNGRASANSQEAGLEAHNSSTMRSVSQSPRHLRAVSTETATVSIKIQEAKS